MAGRDGAFAGAWQDDEGTVVVVKDSRMYGPDGGQLDLKITRRTECSFQMGSETYHGTLTDGKLVWDDGAVWVRVESEHSQPRTAEQTLMPQTNGHSHTVPNGKEPDAASDRARKAFEEEKARKAAALERARAARAAAAEPAEPEPDAKAASEAGIDRARKAFEEEKARKAAALERARAARAAAAEPAEPEPDARTANEEGIDRARKAFEEEKARKAAALERARAARAEQGSDNVSADSGVDRARKAFEEEKARKQAALERARAARMDGQSQPEDTRSEEEKARKAAALERARAASGVDRARKAFEEEKERKAAALERARRASSDAYPGAANGTSRSEAGLDRAKQAFEQEKARKAAALERARARARAAGQAEAAEELGLGPNAGRGRGRGLGGFGSWQLGRGGLGARGLGGARGVGRGMFGGWAGGAQALTPGVLVRLYGLKAKPELNGMIGNCIAFDKSKGRWQVRLEERPQADMLFKEDNLQPVSVDEYEAAQAAAEGMDSRLADRLRCPAEHGMAVEVAAEVYECDVCEADIEVSTKLMYCERCDNAICEACSVEMLKREALKA